MFFFFFNMQWTIDIWWYMEVRSTKLISTIISRSAHMLGGWVPLRNGGWTPGGVEPWAHGYEPDSKKVGWPTKPWEAPGKSRYVDFVVVSWFIKRSRKSSSNHPLQWIPELSNFIKLRGWTQHPKITCQTGPWNPWSWLGCSILMLTLWSELLEGCWRWNWQKYHDLYQWWIGIFASIIIGWRWFPLPIYIYIYYIHIYIYI